MAESTGIAWTDATFNAWTGCTKLDSPDPAGSACAFCYAAEQAKRNTNTFGSWTPGAPRKRTSPAYWKGPVKWNRDAEKAGTRRRVFCASMADVFDNKAPPEWRTDLWALIRATPWLQWQLLTKRPQNIAGMLPPDWGHGFHNVWLGTTVENQTEADRRIPALLDVPAVVRFLSCEPLLGAVDLNRWIGVHHHPDIDVSNPAVRARAYAARRMLGASLDWIIVGGESGHHARPMNRLWVESIQRQCWAAGVPFFFKQVGSGWQPDQGWGGLPLDGGHNADPARWPAELRVQQFPQTRVVGDGR